MTPVTTATNIRALPSFDHRHHGLDLGTLAIEPRVEAGLHQSSVAASGRFGGWPAELGRNHRTQAILVASEDMIGFRVIAGIGHHPRQTDSPQSFGNEWPKLVGVGSRSTAHLICQNEMIAGVADHAQLGIAMINDCFPGLRGANPPLDEVATCARALQTGRVNRRRANPPAATRAKPRCGVEQALGIGGRQQPPRGFLQRGEVWNAAQCQQSRQRRVVFQVRHDAPIIGPQKVLQRQAGEQLMLGECLGTVLVGVLRQRLLRCCQRRQHYQFRRFTRRRHAYITKAKSPRFS